MERKYIAIDLKSFYASVECVERKLDPLKVNLVVADESRTDKTVCLAVSPSLKSYGIGGRDRLYAVKQAVKEINKDRLRYARSFRGSSFYAHEVNNNPYLELSFLIAPPRMNLYMDYSNRIYNIYLKYVAKEDIHVYSIDEVFIDVTPYLKTYKMDAETLCRTIIKDIFDSTGITATGGIGDNLYLAKVAMDIVAKHEEADENGVRIAYLNKKLYKEKLWDHEPLRDFWRIGVGIQNKLNANGMYTLGDVAYCSIKNEGLLYKLFGINAELLIDHVWGEEPTTIKDIKAYTPASKSLGSGQVLHTPYNNEQAKLVLKEMLDSLALDLVSKGYLTNQVVLVVGYDISNLTDNKINYQGTTKKDMYGRNIPTHAIGRVNFKDYNSSGKLIIKEVIKLYDKIVNKDLLIRRINISANNLELNEGVFRKDKVEEFDLFSNFDNLKENKDKEEKELLKERKSQEAILKIRNKYGKNAIMRGMNLEEGATQLERNNEVGGHKAS